MASKTESSLNQQLLPGRDIAKKIIQIRGHRVMLDSDLADLYGVKTFNLNKAVKRHLDRFPPDFMFQLTINEFKLLIFQFGISRSTSHGGRRTPPYAFTEQGVAMLSSVLNSRQAVQVNILVMRAFVRLREMLEIHRKDVDRKLEELEKLYAAHDADIKRIFSCIRELMQPGNLPSNRQIGFVAPKGK
jgi:hypothetical protein